MNYTNNILPIRNYPEYDDNGTRVLYLMPEASLTKTQYDDIVEYIGTEGPGWQVLKIKGSYVIHSDMDATKAKTAVLARLTEVKANPELLSGKKSKNIYLGVKPIIKVDKPASGGQQGGQQGEE